MKTSHLFYACMCVCLTMVFTACESKSDVVGVCGDLVKESLHKYSARSQAKYVDGALYLQEYEFLGGINDDRMVHRTIAFGNGMENTKHVDTLSYQYGDWNESNTAYSLYIYPRNAEPFTVWYQSNAFSIPGEEEPIGGEGTACMARVEKWEKTISSFVNTAWEGEFRSEFVTDSVLEDSVKVTFIPFPVPHFLYDTIKVFKGKMDTLNADTTCYIRFSVMRDPLTLANTGVYYKKEVRTEYDRATRTVKVISQKETTLDHIWCFSDVTSDAKFTILLQPKDSGSESESLSITKYTAGDETKPASLLLSGLTFGQAKN